jgi:PAS domain S-box-containing protein
MLVFSDITARKEAEEQVRHQHQFVNQVLDTLPMGVMVQQAGPRGPVTLWNRRMEQLFGISSRQAAGRSLADLVDPMMAGGLLDAIDTVAEAASPRTFEDVSIACSSGEAFIAQITVAPVFGGHGAQRSLLVILNDVTERFRAEAEQRRLSEALARREESYRTLADNATDLITRHDASGVITFASHVAEDLESRRELGHSVRCIDPRTALYERFITGLRELKAAILPSISGGRERLGLKPLDPRVPAPWITWHPRCGERSGERTLRTAPALGRRGEQNSGPHRTRRPLVLATANLRALPNPPGLRPAPYEEVIASVLSGPLPEDAEMTIEEWKAMRMREHRNPSGRGRFQRLAGDRWVQITDFPTSEGGVVSLLTDVTQLKRIQEELNRQTLMLTSLLDSIPDIIFYKDAQGVYVGCNPAFCEFVGRPRESVLGKTDFDLFPDDLARFFLANDRLMLETGTERRNEEWWRIRTAASCCSTPSRRP